MKATFCEQRGSPYSTRKIDSRWALLSMINGNIKRGEREQFLGSGLRWRVSLREGE